MISMDLVITYKDGTKSQKAINFHAYKDSMILKYIDANTGEPIKLYNEADFDNYDWGNKPVNGTFHVGLVYPS